MKNLISSLVFSITVLSSQAQTLTDVRKYIDNEQYEKAATALRKLKTGDPNNGDNYFWHGEVFYLTEQNDSAKMMYDEGLKKNPSSALCMVGTGKILWIQGKSAEAKKQFYSATVVVNDKTNKMTPQQKSLVLLKIAETYITSPDKDLNEAITQINKAATIDPTNADVNIMMGDALFEQNPANGSNAIAEYKKAADKNKSSATAFFKIGELYLRAKNPEAAHTELDKAITIDPQFAPAYRVKAEAYYYRQKFEDAINMYKKYLDLNSGNVSARIRYVKFLFVAKKYTDVLTEGKSVLQDAPKENVINRLMGYASYENNDCQNGLSYMETFFAKQPEMNVLASDYEYYGKLYTKCGKDSLGVIYLLKAITKDSAKCELYTEIANVYKKAKRYSDAANYYFMRTKSCKNPLVNDYYNLGYAYYYSKQYGKADTAFIKYVEGQKEIAFGYFWRAKCNANLDPENKTWQAKPFYETAILKSTDKDNKKDLEDAYWYMGYYYFVQKDFASAKCCYQKLVALNVPNSDKNKKATDALNGKELSGVTASEQCIRQ